MLISLEYKAIEEGEVVDKVVEFSSSLLEGAFNEESLFAVTVEGESMQPLISDRALVIADLSQKELQDSSIYLVYHGDKMWIKQYKENDDKKEFISLNPKFSHLVYPVLECHVVARVMLTFTKL